MLELTDARRIALETGWLSLTPPSFQKNVLARTTLRTLKAGEALHFAGDDPIGMYGVVAGRLRVAISANDHGPYLTHMLRPGTWIGEGPSITGRPRVVTPTAAVDSELLFLPQSAIHDIVLREPAQWRFFVIPLQGHFEVSVGAIGDLLLRDHGKRIAATLLRLAGCREADARGRRRITIEVSQEELAIMTNVARTTAGAVLRRLAKTRLIEVGYGQVTVLSTAGLRAMIAE